MMNTLFFNINDLALLLLIAQCGMFACILLLTREKSGEGKGILAALLIAFALQALDTLIYWSEPIKALTASFGVWPFWLFKWVPFVQGPLLLAYVRIKLTAKNVSWADAKHALPVLFYPLMLWLVALQLGENFQRGVFEFGYWWQSWAFMTLLWVQKLSVLIYGGLGVWYLQRNLKRLEQSFSNPANAQPLWLPMVVYGFVFLACWHLAAGFVESAGWFDASHIMGVLANYLSFAFVTALVFYSLLKSHIVASPRLELLNDSPKNTPKPIEHTATEPSFKDEAQATTNHEQDAKAAQKLKVLMDDQALYLNPELTLEDLARAARLPERQVSYLLNNILGQNFFEYVNEARVEKAKVLLATHDWPVQRVFEESGFNSKATFNRIFKRYTDMTPSGYRKQFNDL